MKVCDISQYQGTVNFDQLKTAVEAVIIRAGWTGGFDSQFTRNQAEARRVGLGVGYYWYAYPDVAEPERDADIFVEHVGLQPGEVLALDYEETAGGPDWCKRFLDRVQATTGVKPLLYTNQNRVLTLDWSAVKASDYGLWLALWDGSPSRTIDTAGWSYPMKQYTDHGSLPGISGAVDLDEFYGMIEQFKQYGYQGGSNMASVAFITNVFRAALGREPDVGALSHYTAGQYSDPEFVLQDVMASAEHAAYKTRLDVNAAQAAQVPGLQAEITNRDQEIVQLKAQQGNGPAPAADTALLQQVANDVTTIKNRKIVVNFQ